MKQFLLLDLICATIGITCGFALGDVIAGKPINFVAISDGIWGAMVMAGFMWWRIRGKK